MTPAQLATLKAAILADPDLAELAVTSDMGKVADGLQRDQAIADALNAAGYGSTSRPVSCHLAKKLLIKRSRWRAIVAASADAEHPAVEAAYAAVALAEDPRMDADFCDPAATPMLAALVATGLITADDRAALVAMCLQPGSVTAADVSRALRGPWGDE